MRGKCVVYDRGAGAVSVVGDECIGGRVGLKSFIEVWVLEFVCGVHGLGVYQEGGGCSGGAGVGLVCW